MANTLRRIMIAEVPTLCIDIVEYEENTTALNDEFLAHRLGLIPLRSVKRMSTWQYNHACDCDFSCENCSAKFTLDCSFESLAAKRNINPKDIPSITVTSRDLESHSSNVRVCHYSSDQETRANLEESGIAIVVLGPGQSI